VFLHHQEQSQFATLGGFMNSPLSNRSLLSSLGLASVFALASGCTLRANSTELGVAEAQLVSDDQESASSDDDLEDVLDQPLSGSDPAEPGAPSEALQAQAASEPLVDIKLRARRHFQPEGCLTTTIEGLVATHVFNNCTGPRGLRTFNGTVVSTWSLEVGKASVIHRATDFKINGATISGSRAVSYTKAGRVFTKTRVGDWSGTTASGKEIKHQADFISVYDANTGCVLRNGSASSSVGARSFSRKVEGLEVCGLVRGRCPKAGKVTLTRGDKSLTIEFSGGRDVDISLPNGRSASRQISCIE
jgi:hypothetical protein